MKLQSGQVDPETYQVTVETDDGAVPIELLSQGTQSLLGWVGVLLERMYEQYDQAAEPRKQPALVLIDEIDAHMHPLWQQAIVPGLSKLFPKVQFIASTHSPLTVSNIQQGRLIVFVRDPQTRSVVAHCPDEDPAGMGAAALLTSVYFGLYSQLDTETQKQLDRKRQLAAKEPNELTDDDRDELRSLDEKLTRKGFNYAFRDPLYAQFLEEWARETREHPELSVSPLTPAERERQAEYVRQIVAKMKKREEG
jgi:hypothetical protein